LNTAVSIFSPALSHRLQPIVVVWYKRCLFAQKESIEGLYNISLEDKKFLEMSFRGEESFITELLRGILS